MIDLQHKASDLLDTIGPLSDSDLNAIVTASLGDSACGDKHHKTVCVLEAIAIRRGLYYERGAPAWGKVCSEAFVIGCNYDCYYSDHGRAFTDALRVEAISRITQPAQEVVNA